METEGIRENPVSFCYVCRRFRPPAKVRNGLSINPLALELVTFGL
jgi:hypothetical protein